MRGSLRGFSWTMFAAMVALVAIGATAIWSAGGARAEESFHGMWKAHLATAGAGLVLYFVLAACDYRKFLRWASWPAYAVSIALLVAVLAFGSSVYGGRRWLWFFQPSEVAKLFVICVLARLFGGGRHRTFRWFCAGCAVVGVPVALILAEPDLGTALTLVPAALMILFAARVWRRGLVTVLALAAAGACAVMGAVYEAEKPGVSPERREAIMRYVPLRPHQVKRVKVFLFPEDDIAGAGYNLRQAKISIGSGGFSGKGLRKGELNHLKYLPQSVSMNDFIFCVWAEETGFVGTMALIALFGALLLPGALIAASAADVSGRLLALGVSTLLFVHAWTNMAMSVGLVPITGLPLPFISSGRTFLVAAMAGLGLVQSVGIHGREKVK